MSQVRDSNDLTPEILPPVVFLSLHGPEHSREVTCTSWCEIGVKVWFVVAISNVDPSVSRYWVWINCLGWCNAMLPLLLHFSMHDKQRVVWKMNRDLSLRISILYQVVFGVPRHNTTDAKLPCHAEGQRSNHGSRAQIREMITVIANGFLRTIVAIDKGCVGRPLIGTLVLQFLAIGVARLDSVLYLFIGCFLYLGPHL